MLFSKTFLTSGLRCPRKVITCLHFELEGPRIIYLHVFFYFMLHKQLEDSWRRVLLVTTEERPSIEVKEKEGVGNHLTVQGGGA